MESGGYFGLDKMIGHALEAYAAQEEDYLLNNNTFDVESDEEATSGDEDELSAIDLLLKEDAPALDDEKKYSTLREPLFTPIGSESALTAGGGAMSSGGGATGKLPFNRRKIRYFDAVTASERMAARAYLQQELRKSKQREALLLAKRLRRVQRQEKRRMKQERGAPLDDTDLSDQENDDPKESALIASSFSQFNQPMTPCFQLPKTF